MRLDRYLQRALAGSQAGLRRAGVFYPVEGGRPAQYGLSRHYGGGPDADGVTPRSLRWLAAGASRRHCTRMILSGEYLSLHRPAAVAALKADLEARRRWTRPSAQFVCKPGPARRPSPEPQPETTMSLAEHPNPIPGPTNNLAHRAERIDLAAALRWTARLEMHEGVANHFSLAVNEDGASFLMNPNLVHFSRIRASDLLLIDAGDPATMARPDAPDPTAWGLHGALHRLCPHARCAMHVHPTYATVLACLADSTLPPIDQSSAMFFNRVAIDDAYDGLAFEAEAERCCATLSDPSKKVLVMGNHGIMVIGADVAETFNRLYYFERAAETYIKALSTRRPLRILSDEIAEKTAREIETYPGIAGRHLAELKAILDAEGSDYAS